MNYGIVYVLTNSAMPGLVKIGMTTRENIDERMRELFNTGVPVPFKCEYACKVAIKDCSDVEKALHIAFHPYRINPTREFFEINPEQAIAILKLVDRSNDITNNDITNEIAAEINNDLTLEDKEAGKKLATKRRPAFNFKEMNIPIGARLKFTENESDVEVSVSTEKRVVHNGIETSLTALTKKLLGLDYAVQPTPYWTYEGRNLHDIYEETYTL